VPEATTGIEPVDRSNEAADPHSEVAEEGEGDEDVDG
jgi:hypothetical protein